jgi:hypothetical protein
LTARAQILGQIVSNERRYVSHVLVMPWHRNVAFSHSFCIFLYALCKRGHFITGYMMYFICGVSKLVFGKRNNVNMKKDRTVAGGY